MYIWDKKEFYYTYTVLDFDITVNDLIEARVE